MSAFNRIQCDPAINRPTYLDQDSDPSDWVEWLGTHCRHDDFAHIHHTDITEMMNLLQQMRARMMALQKMVCMPDEYVDIPLGHFQRYCREYAEAAVAVDPEKVIQYESSSASIDDLRYLSKAAAI